MLKQVALCAALVTATSSVAVAGNGTNLTKYVADSTQLMLVFDVTAARNAKLVKDSFNKLLDSQPDARDKLAALGMDPMRDIDTVAFSFGGVDTLSNARDTASMLIIIEGKFPKEALEKMKSSGTKTTYNGVDFFTKDDTDGAVVGNRIFFAKKGRMNATIDLIKGKSKASLASSAGGKAMREVIKRASTKSHMWGAVLLPAQDRQSAASAQIPVEAVSFGFQFSSDLEGGMRLEMATPAAAESSLKTLTTALPQVKMMMGTVGLDVAAGTLALAQDKASVTAAIKITNTELKNLFAMIGANNAKSSGSGPAANSNAPTPTPPPAPPPATGGLGAKKTK
jgi:hypothetical protein